MSICSVFWTPIMSVVPVWVNIRGVLFKRMMNYGHLYSYTSEIGALLNSFHLKRSSGKNLHSHGENLQGHQKTPTHPHHLFRNFCAWSPPVIFRTFQPADDYDRILGRPRNVHFRKYILDQCRRVTNLSDEKIINLRVFDHVHFILSSNWLSEN